MKRQFLPALRGIFGDWAYYSCLMSLSELSARVTFAKEIHKSKGLSALIQRELKRTRAKEIAEYLQTNRERFFNSLVVAVYDGDPAWHQLDHFTPQVDDIAAGDVPEDAIASLGFLSFNGKEKLFALDGQHRLAGIQEALSRDKTLGDDEVSVILVAHKNSGPGLIRTRRLFTTLNKTAKPVSKGEIIALDEADVMAITVRDLVENDPHFSDGRILIVANSNLPASDVSHLTTIANLYDVLTILFSKVKERVPIKDLQYKRPTDKLLAEYRDFALRYFELLAKNSTKLSEYFKAPIPEKVVKSQRTVKGGNVLFRPVGQTLFAHITVELIKRHSLEDAMAFLRLLPTDLARAPYVNLLWNPTTSTLDLRRQALVRRVLLYMLDVVQTEKQITRLRDDLAKVLACDPSDVVLPNKVVPGSKQ
jgi:DNA sulfur modification protein DndB